MPPIVSCVHEYISISQLFDHALAGPQESLGVSPPAALLYARRRIQTTYQHDGLEAYPTNCRYTILMQLRPSIALVDPTGKGDVLHSVRRDSPANFFLSSAFQSNSVARQIKARNDCWIVDPLARVLTGSSPAACRCAMIHLGSVIGVVCFQLQFAEIQNPTQVCERSNSSILLM